MESTEGVSLGEIQDECRMLERSILALRLGTLEEIAPHRPGASENADEGPRGWWRFCSRLHRIHGQGEGHPGGSAESDELTALADGAGLQTFLNATVEVTLTALAGEDVKRVLVYPKGLEALTFCHEVDERCRWLALRTDDLQARGTAEDLATIIASHEEILRLTALLLWAATTKGAELPFEYGATPPEAPAWLRQLDIGDLCALNHAFLMVNGLRLEIVRRRLVGKRTADAEPGSQLLRWTVFVGHLAIKMKTRPSTIAKTWTLGETLMAVAASGALEEEARRKAERERETTVQLGGR